MTKRETSALAIAEMYQTQKRPRLSPIEQQVYDKVVALLVEVSTIDESLRILALDAMLASTLVTLTIRTPLAFRQLPYIAADTIEKVVALDKEVLAHGSSDSH